MAKPTNGACCVWDLTVAGSVDRERLKDAFNTAGKRWCFQLEAAPTTGTLHYQCRISLKVRKRENQVVSWAHQVFGDGVHVSRTSTANSLNDFYVMKSETRVEGPWSDSDEVDVGFIDWIYDSWVPRDFQGAVISMVSDHLRKIATKSPDLDRRSIHSIIDTKGCIGKTAVINYLGQRRQALRVPSINDTERLMTYVANMIHERGNIGAYIIDMPRAADCKNQAGFYRAIEQLKSGWTYDWRYKSRDFYFPPPFVLVVCNEAPNVKLLSADMWRLWMVNDNHQLVAYDPNAQLNRQAAEQWDALNNLALQTQGYPGVALQLKVEPDLAPPSLTAVPLPVLPPPPPPLGLLPPISPPRTSSRSFSPTSTNTISV